MCIIKGMNSIITQFKSSVSPSAAGFVTLTQKEYGELRAGVEFWRVQHERATIREQELKTQVAKLKAKVRDLNQRVFGKKTEKNSSKKEKWNNSQAPARPRGQKKGGKGHGRTLLNNLPVEETTLEVEDANCPICGGAGDEMPETDDCEVVELEVKAYRRRYRKKRVRFGCNCKNRLGMITAPSPNRLIPKGKLGISVWITILLDKFLYCNPTNRLLESLKGYGLELAQGTITGGLKKIAPLFDPIMNAFWEHSLKEDYWHADETRWRVFAKLEGKDGNRWYLWVFRSQDVVVYVLAPTRSTAVLRNYFKTEDIKENRENDDIKVIVCDRYSAYKCISKEVPWILLAFCWAHQRRDFLDLARKWPKSEEWALKWVETIGTLYHLNNRRLNALEDSVEFKQRDLKLCACLDQIVEKRDRDLHNEKISESWKSPLKSMKNHWFGLTLFADHPEIPMDNNRGENALRPPVVGRKNYFGSGSVWSAMLTASMFTVLMTIKYWGINPRYWLKTFLEACAEAGNCSPDNLNSFLPWMMDDQRLAAFRTPSISDTS